jgi:hypothetical protein
MAFLGSLKRFLKSPACGCKKTKKTKKRQRGGYSYSPVGQKRYSRKSSKRFHRKSSKQNSPNA